MKVLFFEHDDRFIFGLPLGFRDAGHTILVSGPVHEEKIDRILHKFQPDLAMLLGWTTLHTDSNLHAIHDYCQRYDVPLIYWATEDPTFTHIFSLPLIKKTKPTYVFTVAPSKVPLYESLGIPAQHLPFAYQPSICKPVPCSSWCSKDIAVVANAYPNVLYANPRHYRRQSLRILIEPLLKKSMTIDFWGKHWDQMEPFLGMSIPKEHLHGYIHYLKAPHVYACSNIIIGLQNYPSELVTMRTYEILGSRGFLITSHNTELCQLFQHTQDLIISTSPEETLDYVDYYQQHPDQLDIIKNNGYKAVLNHTYAHRAQTIVNALQNVKILPSLMP